MPEVLAHGDTEIRAHADRAAVPPSDHRPSRRPLGPDGGARRSLSSYGCEIDAATIRPVGTRRCDRQSQSLTFSRFPPAHDPRRAQAPSLEPVITRMRVAVELDQIRLRQLAEQALGGPTADPELLLNLPPGQRAVLGQPSQGPPLFVVERQLGLAARLRRAVAGPIGMAHRRAVLVVDLHDDLVGQVVALLVLGDDILLAARVAQAFPEDLGDAGPQCPNRPHRGVLDRRGAEAVGQRLAAKMHPLTAAVGLTQRDLAERLGREQSFVGRVETGQRRIDLVELVWIARACGADPRAAVAEITEAIAQAVPAKKRRNGRGSG